MKKITKNQIEAIKIRANKNLESNSSNYSDIMELCDFCLFLDQTNFLLKSKLLDLELSIPDDKRLESLIATKMEILACSDGKEYLEATNSSTGTTWVLSIFKKFGKTPWQLYKEADIIRKKIRNNYKEFTE